jgi:adsorption protein B
MVPAWKEYDVIAAMIENLVKTLEYRNYVVFVGTYCNDEATINEVDRMRRRYKQLRRVEVPNPGPTCKADCLNWIVKAIFLHEEQHNMEFAGVILHDSEDVLHPLELHLFNYLLPRMDMVQLPVTSLEREWYELVAGTYMDEFAEWHGKDMQVRESMSSMVPSAGVGTCFSRRALLALSADAHDEPFNTQSLTEDYEVASHLARLGMRLIFVRFPVQYQVIRRAWFGWKPDQELTVTMPLCVREFFPNTFRTAYRQRARWTLGIGLQSWETISWQGSFSERYMLLRDRKGIVTAFVSIFAYVLVLQLSVFLISAWLGIWNVYYPSILANNDWMPMLLQFNLFALFLRAGSRAYFVNELYGWEHAVMSVPRMVVGNFLNFMAVARAWRMYMAYLFRGLAMAWDKTMHDFPTADRLGQKHHKLGELLTVWQAIDQTNLNSALALQEQAHQPLGRILLSNGWLDDETLAEAISYQSDLPRAQFLPDSPEFMVKGLPVDLSIRLRILCIGKTENGHSVIAVANLLSSADQVTVRSVLGHDPIQHIAREGEIMAGLRLISGTTTSFVPGVSHAPLLGDLLIERGLVRRNDFDGLMAQYQPALHGRIGDFLTQSGVISRAALEEAIATQRLAGSQGTSTPTSESAFITPSVLGANA